MTSDRNIPYCNFNFIVNLGLEEGEPDSIQGGFSDVTGLETEIDVAEYRTGVDRENHVRKVPGLHKVSDVSLKRGIIDSSDLWTWLTEIRHHGPQYKRDVTITLRDEAGTPVQSWKLQNAFPKKYAGPTLAAKGGGEVAIEELVLSIDGMVLQVGEAEPIG